MLFIIRNIVIEDNYTCSLQYANDVLVHASRLWRCTWAEVHTKDEDDAAWTDAMPSVEYAYNLSKAAVLEAG